MESKALASIIEMVSNNGINLEELLTLLLKKVCLYLTLMVRVGKYRKVSLYCPLH